VTPHDCIMVLSLVVIVVVAAIATWPDSNAHCEQKELGAIAPTPDIDPRPGEAWVYQFAEAFPRRIVKVRGAFYGIYRAENPENLSELDHYLSRDQFIARIDPEVTK
jgi:hypothetical protein